MADKESSPTPPYIPYKTFRNYLDALQGGRIPGRIDSSVLGNYSGAARSLLLITLRFFGLINGGGTPTPRLTKLVEADGAERQRELRELLKEKYAFLDAGGFNLANATQSQLHEAFESAVKGDTVRKCAAFYVFAAKDAGLVVSPHLNIRARNPVTRKRGRTVNDNGGSPNEILPPAPQPFEAKDTVMQALLGKFPDFDPAWPDEVKAKWFDGFERLMGTTMKKD